MRKQPNVLFVFGDQWRAQAFGYRGDPNVQTPNVDAFSTESVSLVNTVSNVPLCCPWRASLLTGQYPLTHGIIVNDQSICSQPVSMADAFNAAGYHTGYIGKWHIDGHGRFAYIPQERRLGFQYWRGFECTHDYNKSQYYADTPECLMWQGYDAFAQTDCAIDYLHTRATASDPFALFVSWGPPHNPYQTAPEAYSARYIPDQLRLRRNVPEAAKRTAQEWLAGYYAHCTALDNCFGRLLTTLEHLNLADNTVVVFTSDHGDMLGSHGFHAKQQPYDESVCTPLLIRWPEGLGQHGRVDSVPFNSPDYMPTLLGLCSVAIPETVEGIDHSPRLHGEKHVDDGPAYMACYRPHHELRYETFGRDWRGIRTEHYTYARDHDGPWLLFDNDADPYQMRNIVGYPAAQSLLREMDRALDRTLERRNDTFETGDELCRRYNVALNADNDVASGYHAPAREEMS
ncbi:MAG TPA: sulfatase [Armatimonadota bacterium]|nr:sulfatase [Armatimonadota bacterium]